jgi:hypothetical protein
MTFVEKLIGAQTARTRFALYIAPQIDRLPPAFQQHDDPFLPYMRSIYAATNDLVCAYLFNFASFLALGAAGAIALERSIALATQTHITILDARFASEDFVRVWDDVAFGCDSVTLSTEAPLPAYQARPDRQAFTVTSSDLYPARIDFSNENIHLDQQIVPLLPLGTLDRARSLTFEETLRSLVRDYVSG